MFAHKFEAQWTAWLAAMAVPLHARLAWRLPAVVAGILFASGRRTISRWWLAAGIGQGFRSHYYFLDSVGREVEPMAKALLRIVMDRIPAGDRLVFALDDTPTRRYGPKVQGAGIHHNPTPGPAGSKFLYGPSWVTLSRVVHHARSGVIGLPLPAALYVRKIASRACHRRPASPSAPSSRSPPGSSTGSVRPSPRPIGSGPGWPSMAATPSGTSSNQRSRPG